MIKTDNIIIGAGPGGYELAAALASRGESVVIAERDSLGGTCLNRGCIPTKALCASANAVLDARSAHKLGLDVPEVRIDFERVRSRVKEVVDGLREGVAGLLGKCTVVGDEARFIGPNQVRIGTEDYEAPRIIIATGSAPAYLNIPGAEHALTSDRALWLDKVPSSMTIIGGGVIGMEFASIFAALGSKVTIIEYCKEILPTVDPEIAKRLRTTLSRRGIDIITSAAVLRIDRAEDRLRIVYQGKKCEDHVVAETAVMAVGRRAVVPEGFMEHGGAVSDKGFIIVDENMRTTLKGIYAVGDVNGLLMLAHAAYAQGRVVLHGKPEMFDKRLVPSVVFTSPEVACVGPSPIELEAEGVRFRTVKRPFASNGKACADGHPEGLLKMLVREDDNVIMAVSVIGHHASALIAEATILVTEKVRLEDVGERFVHAHPTLSELFA